MTVALRKEEISNIAKRLVKEIDLEKVTIKEIRERIGKDLGIEIEKYKERIDLSIDEAMASLLEEESIIECKEGDSKRNGTKGRSEEEKLEKLKGFVFKCGIRKVWKKELENLNYKESIKKVERMLEELGVEGRPSLQKCKKIKEKREHDKEMEVIDQSNIITARFRSRSLKDENIKENQTLSSFDYLKKLGDLE